jgi:hypothetical protein
VRANDDLEDYRKFHLANERRRVHKARYADGTIPIAA